MNRRRLARAALLSAALLAAAGLGAWAPRASAQGGPPPVVVATPLAERIVDWDEYTGRFEARERVELRARVSGYLDAVRFRDGQLVAPGDPLFEIDPRPFENAVARARAELASAVAQQARAAAELARGQELVRNRNLSVATLDEREAAMSAADAQVDIAQAALRDAMLDLEFTQVRAPIGGRISDRRVDVGNLVTGGDVNATLLAVIVSVDPIYFEFEASEADFLRYARLHQEGRRASSRGAPNPVYLRLQDEERFERLGFMNFVDNEIDPNSGTIRGRAEVPNVEGFLTPGLFARLRLIGSDPYDAVLIPEEAVLSDQARKIVMVVDADGVVAPRPIELGPLYRGLRVVRAGLSVEDQIVISGLLRA